MHINATISYLEILLYTTFCPSLVTQSHLNGYFLRILTISETLLDTVIQVRLSCS